MQAAAAAVPTLEESKGPPGVELPPGWEAVFDEGHQAHYYWNTISNEARLNSFPPTL